jgi:hypothetical protein
MSEVYLHVGPVKTGSTYLQSILWNSRHVLREQGMLLPADHDNEFFLAANDVQGGRFVLIDLPEAEGAWSKVAARARSWPGRVLITHELLGFCEPDQVQRIAGSLDPADLHLIVMARCRADLLPSLYQEKVKMVDPDQSWDEFLRAYRDCHRSWPQAPGAVVHRWLPHVARRRVHVVTVPRRGAGRQLLLGRFAEALGLDPTRLTAADAPANASLDAVGVELLRAVIAQTTGRLDRRAQRRLINGQLVPLLRDERRARRPLRLPASFQDLMRDAAARDIEAITTAGGHVHGDLDDLRPTAEAFEGSRTPDRPVAQAEILAAAVDALIAAARRQPIDTSRF